MSSFASEQEHLWQQAEAYHFRMQEGMYFSEKIQWPGATLLYSELIEDYFWNYAAQIETSEAQLPQLVAQIEAWLKQRQRLPCFYLAPWSKPHGKLQAFLRERGYALVFTDPVMFWQPGGQSRSLSAWPQLQIQRVWNPEDFLAVFSAAYADSPTVPGEAPLVPHAYMAAFRQSWSSLKQAQALHAVGYFHEQPVAIASLLFSEGWGGLYNVGTLPEYRGRGWGEALSRWCIEQWQTLGGQQLFLQVEAGSGLESWYQKLGFCVQYQGEGWAQFNP